MAPITLFPLGVRSLGYFSSPAGTGVTEVDMSMMKATAVHCIALKTKIATLQAELQRLSAQAGCMGKMIDRAASDYCASVPDALSATELAPGLCK